MPRFELDRRAIAQGGVEAPGVVDLLDEGADVGEDDDSPVTEDYVAGIKSRFTGKIDKVTLEVK